MLITSEALRTLIEQTLKPAEQTDSGVYVAAWVYVTFEGHVLPGHYHGSDSRRPTDEAIRQLARDQWQQDGELEIDDNAVVSWPEEVEE